MDSVMPLVAREHDVTTEIKGEDAAMELALAEEELLQGGDGEEEDDDEDVWDDDFGEKEGEDEAPVRPSLHLVTSLSEENRRCMEDWADNDEDEDNWKDALQARVNQLELVVPSKSETSMLVASTKEEPMYATPVDQRATLTLVPMMAPITRSTSAPAAAETTRIPKAGCKPHQRTKETTTSKSATGAGSQTQARKRSNSRDYLTRTPSGSGAEILRPIKALHTDTAHARPGASSNVFVRAVVARGNNAQRSTSSEKRGTAVKHEEDPFAMPSDEMLALSDAEMIRRFVLHDVKKMSIERIVADAKRLQYLEDVHRRHHSVSEDTTHTARLIKKKS
ncbi:hypothetical protein Poli38472_012186 [Pythium oligandrum]|uniref:Uncharacterized protein n=1 Tax=Pythium oligandrum TaxID=41045 RepID=A0A8K1CQW0_PYTOL|nr:hypothetical protein Poli38472_012186 [Pythium oligandrum]|eukprot:TMW67070.1 hypothetical protein Poli38472_012186 [Pythium oligandrum]